MSGLDRPLIGVLVFVAIIGIGIFFLPSRPSLSGTGMKDELILPAALLVVGFVVLWLLVSHL